MNTCTIYVCGINYDARSLYKFINNKYTTQTQAAHAEDLFNELPTSIALKFDGFTTWTSHKKVLNDWSMPYMIRDEIYQRTGWRIVSFDISCINVNNNFVGYAEDMTFEFKTKRNDYAIANETIEDEEVVSHNKELTNEDEE